MKNKRRCRQKNKNCFLAECNQERQLLAHLIKEKEKNRKREDRKLRDLIRTEKTSLKSAANQDSTIVIYCVSGHEEREIIAFHQSVKN